MWSDIACPWCYIGKRNFEAGLAAFAAQHPDAAATVEVEFHSYELAPDTPVDFDGSEADFLSRYKGMSVEQAHEGLARVTHIAAKVGLAYDFDALRHTNTRFAHQVLHLAKQQGRQPAMVERLMRAYFVEGRHVGRVDDLADLAAEVGLDRDEVVAALTDGRFLPAVLADVARARELDIHGVPFFVFDDEHGLAGAHQPEAFARVLRAHLPPS